MDATFRMFRRAKTCLTRYASKLAAAVAVGYLIVEVVRFLNSP
jgi:hypothetical protein